jgi:hypothetical protein
VIPEPVRQLIAQHIQSVEQLEVLILLRTHRDRAWTVAEVNDHIKSSPSSVVTRLDDLAARGFLRRTDQSFHYQAREDVEAAVAQLAAAYTERRFSVIELIFSKPAAKLRAFADAFKVGKKRGPDG